MKQIDRFKFRVWAKNSKEYHYHGNKFLADVIDDSNYIVEQCTGLKDKNDKLIYDNDYVRVINQDTKDRPDLQVGHIWVDELNCRWIKFAKEELSWSEFCSLIDYDLTLEIEVIGNGNENPDLLENKDE